MKSCPDPNLQFGRQPTGTYDGSDGTCNGAHPGRGVHEVSFEGHGMDQMRTLSSIDECPGPNLQLSMNIILWNCKGALNPNFHQSVENITNCHSPSMMIIIET